jgi:hypothetical protein
VTATRRRYWEIIADNLSKNGWSYGYVSAIDSHGRTIWIADAHRDDGKKIARFQFASLQNERAETEAKEHRQYVEADNLLPHPCFRFVHCWKLIYTHVVNRRCIGVKSSLDHYRDDGKRFAVYAEEKLTAFLELESPIEPFSASSFL